MRAAESKLALALVLLAGACKAGGEDLTERPQPLEELAEGATPTWKAPPLTADRPIALRAAKVGGRVTMFGYGAPKDTGTMAFAIRYHDAKDEIVEESSQAGPLTPTEGAWYRVGSAEPMRKETVFTKISAQVYGLGDPTGKTKWKGDPLFRGFYSWRFPLPKAPPKADAAFPLAMETIGKDVFAANAVFPRRVVYTAAVYNHSDKRVKRAELQLELADAQGPLPRLGGAWVESVGDEPVEFLEPKAWGVVRFEGKQEIDRSAQATTQKLVIERVEGERGAVLYAMKK